MIKPLKLFTFSGILFFPLFAFAQTSPQDLTQLIEIITNFINPIAALITSLAFIFFLWGVTKYIASAGDENKKQEGKDIMLWGIIGLFVIFAIWGILAILINTFFAGTPGPIQVN